MGFPKSAVLNLRRMMIHSFLLTNGGLFGKSHKKVRGQFEWPIKRPPPDQGEKGGKALPKEIRGANVPPHLGPKDKGGGKAPPEEEAASVAPQPPRLSKEMCIQECNRSFDGRAVVVNVCEYMLGISEPRNRKATATQDRCRMGSNMKTDRN